jgi:hypothetical protein
MAGDCVARLFKQNVCMQKSMGYNSLLLSSLQLFLIPINLPLQMPDKQPILDHLNALSDGQVSQVGSLCVNKKDIVTKGFFVLVSVPSILLMPTL